MMSHCRAAARNSSRSIGSPGREDAAAARGSATRAGEAPRRSIDALACVCEARCPAGTIAAPPSPLHDLCSLWRSKGAARVPRRRPRHMRGVLRHQAAGRDPLPSDVRLPAVRADAPGGSRAAPAGARCRPHRPDHPGSHRAPAAPVLPAARRHSRPGDDPLRPIIDTDVADAAGALAATYETSARGVIYEHQTQSLPAQRLLSDLQAALTELGRDGGGRLVEREAPYALRAIERGVRAVVGPAGSGPHRLSRHGEAGPRGCLRGLPRRARTLPPTRTYRAHPSARLRRPAIIRRLRLVTAACQ